MQYSSLRVRRYERAGAFGDELLMPSPGGCSYVKSGGRDQELPSPGGQVCQDEGALRPVDLPVGYTTRRPGRRAEQRRVRWHGGLRPGRRAVGRCQVNGTKLDSQACAELMVGSGRGQWRLSPRCLRRGIPPMFRCAIARDLALYS